MLCSVFRAPREYNGEEYSEYRGTRVTTAEYVALSGAGWETRTRIPLLADEPSRTRRTWCWHASHPILPAVAGEGVGGGGRACRPSGAERTHGDVEVVRPVGGRRERCGAGEEEHLWHVREQRRQHGRHHQRSLRLAMARAGPPHREECRRRAADVRAQRAQKGVEPSAALQAERGQQVDTERRERIDRQLDGAAGRACSQLQV